MKFSELDEAGWPDLQPYFDTCLLPVTGLLGGEAPWEMADLAADTGAWLAPLEQAFKGRTVTLPAFHYYDGSADSGDKLGALCLRFRQAGFRHVVLVSGHPGLLKGGEGGDLIIQPVSDDERPEPETLRRTVAALWRGSTGQGLPSDSPEPG